MEQAVQLPKPMRVLKAEMVVNTGPAREMAANWFRSPNRPMKNTSARLYSTVTIITSITGRLIFSSSWPTLPSRISFSFCIAPLPFD